MKGRLELALRDAMDVRPIAGLLIFLVVWWACRWFVSATTLGAPTRGALDTGMWLCWFFGGLCAISLGSRAVGVPLSDGSHRWLLSGPLPVTRWAAERIAVHTAVTVALTSVPLFLQVAVSWPRPMAAWALFTTFEVVWLASLAGVLGVVTRPLHAAVLAFGIWWIGHLVGPTAAVLVSSGHPTATTWLRLLPDLDTLDAHGAVVRGVPVAPWTWARALLWSSAWTGIVLAFLPPALRWKDL